MSLQAPTLYEYYTSNGITSGLSANQSYFTLNDKNITLYSGSLHYFRVPKQYWRDRLRKLRAAGLNTVETYVPWNLHEPEPEHYDFGQGGSDFEDFLDVKNFLEIAKEEDLFAIIRPGPYICAEFEFGGFPSWLLREKGIKFRTSESTYMKYVTRYFNVLLPILAMLQFTKGGPIIAFQVENEYGSTERKGRFVPDREYLRLLRDNMKANGIVELLFTSDSPSDHGSVGTLPGELLQTANFQSNPEEEFAALNRLQPNKPLMATEFWSGWFDHWSENHHLLDPQTFYNIYERILKNNASVNLYMFHGGTNFGFLNGANVNNDRRDNSNFQPTITSYDYDAPLTESGNYTEKYAMTKSLIKKYNKIITKIPDQPEVAPVTVYPSLTVTQQLPFSDMLVQEKSVFNSANVIPMEMLPINNSGQSFGYIVYRKQHLDIPKNAILLLAGHVCDSVIVLVNDILVSKPLLRSSDLDGFGFWRQKNSSIILTPQDLTNATLDLIAVNWGRVNFGSLDQYYQFKGLWQGRVYLNTDELLDWQIIPLQFRRTWISNLSGWSNFNPSTLGPTLYRTYLEINTPQDTFIDMQDWTKGIIIVNNFVLGRYAKIGPQQCLYLPAPFLKVGQNEIVIFEEYIPAEVIRFSNKPIIKTIN